MIVDYSPPQGPGAGTTRQAIFSSPVLAVVVGAVASLAGPVAMAAEHFTPTLGTSVPNVWAADHAWVDERGHLHLKVARDAAGQWRCAEVISDRSFGYGEYRFTFSGPTRDLDPNVVLGLFTYLDDSHEIDFELARWGRVAEPNNAQFVVQPATVSRMVRFATGTASRLTCRLVWTPHRVHWQCWPETGGPGVEPLATWTFAGSDVPIPSKEKFHMNLWLMRGQPPTNGRPVEVVIESFEFRAASL